MLDQAPAWRWYRDGEAVLCTQLQLVRSCALNRAKGELGASRIDLCPVRRGIQRGRCQIPMAGGNKSEQEPETPSCFLD